MSKTTTTAPPSNLQLRQATGEVKTDYRALTSLRFFAAIAVVIYHYGTKVKGIEQVPKPLRNLIIHGPSALCFFFVLSGFVLAVSYRDRIINESKGRRAFWLARFARLYPAYLLAFLLFVPIAIEKHLIGHRGEALGAAHTQFLAGAVLSPLLLQSWTSFSQVWNGPSWSLSVEAFFYLLFPYIAFLTRRRIAVAAAASAALWLISLLFVYAHVTGRLSHHVFYDYILYNPIFWLPCFVVGIGVARFAGAWQLVPGVVASTIASALLLATVLVCALCGPGYDEIIVTTGLLPLLTVVIISCSHKSSIVVRILGMPLLYELGGVSYITYIIEAPLWHYFTVTTNGLAGYPLMRQQVSVWQFLLFLPFLLWASFIISRYLERPARTWITQRWSESARPTRNRPEKLVGLVRVTR